MTGTNYAKKDYRHAFKKWLFLSAATFEPIKYFNKYVDYGQL